ncbi:MAG: hypothetical protein JWO38_7919 [Gemmataceae bacterium]|nr:hypothetical protein [Gemmataceae bacterium]
MNNTKWDELRLAMYNLGDLCPFWRTKDLSGYLSSWDGEWFYHFCDGGYSSIEWVEIQVKSADQDAAILELLRQIHLPGHRIEQGFRIYGYARDGQAVDYI